MRLGFFKRKKEEKEKKAATSTRPLKTAQRPVVTVRDVFTAFSLSFFESPGRALAKTFEFDRLFSRAGLHIHPIKYGAETMAMLVLSAVFVVIGFIVTMFTIRLSVVQMIIGIVICVTIPIMVFVVRLAHPYVAMTMRKVETENELPFFMAYVATMVRGGYGLEKVVERVSQLRVFKAIRREAQMVITRIKMFGDDPITALEKVASDHPSTRFRDIMLGYTTTLRSGGDVLHYLEIRTRELIESRMNEVRNILNRLATFLELYIIFGIVVSITLFIFFVVNTAISAAQAARTPEGLTSMNIDVTVPALYNFFVLPLMGFAIMWAIHVNQPRTPIRYNEVYLTLLAWLPISIAAFVLVLIVTGGISVLGGVIDPQGVKSLVYATAAAFLTVSIPPAIKYRSVVKTHKGLVRSTADFLRDISEIRKTGLSPEKCIVLVSSRNYRNLTPVVERAAAALSIGFSLEEAIRKALRGVKEWFVIASLRFLVDSTIVGGGSPEVIDALARFTQTLGELEEETRRRMRSQLFLPYFGAILLASIPMIILYMLLSIAKIPIATATPLILVLSMGSMVNSFIMGLIAGKASQSTTAAGFIHAAALTAVSLAALATTFAYIGM
ncbi:MAG: type II secretion system F family protein [Ignisphaera sp.]